MHLPQNIVEFNWKICFSPNFVQIEWLKVWDAIKRFFYIVIHPLRTIGIK